MHEGSITFHKRHEKCLDWSCHWAHCRSPPGTKTPDTSCRSICYAFESTASQRPTVWDTGQWSRRCDRRTAECNHECPPGTCSTARRAVQSGAGLHSVGCQRPCVENHGPTPGHTRCRWRGRLPQLVSAIDGCRPNGLERKEMHEKWWDWVRVPGINLKWAKCLGSLNLLYHKLL